MVLVHSTVAKPVEAMINHESMRFAKENSRKYAHCSAVLKASSTLILSVKYIF
jgi:hypothetical protein